MGRFRGGGSYGHAIKRDRADEYRLFWTYDRYVSGSRLRFPTTHMRFTDTAGAKRFAKKWGLELPQ